MASRSPLDTGRELLEAFERCARVTEYLVGVLPDEVWRAAPSHKDGRTIAGMVAHMHSVRRSFAKMALGEHRAPPLDGRSASREEALDALGRGREALMEVFGGALERGDGRVKGLPRRTIDMMTYLMQHDAHHRGQIARQARELGHALGDDDVMRIWGWKKLP